MIPQIRLMKVFTTIRSIQHELASLHQKTQVGLVPTMGALHEGHLSIVRMATNENEVTVVTIFVNPTQFDKQEDLLNYPKDTEKDMELLAQEGCDYIFMPSVEEMYTEKISSDYFDFEGLDIVMEGAHRKGHFDGVGTIVNKIFDIIKPTRAYFGEKDFQQLQIINKLVQKKHLNIEIIPCEIFREENGLAMSSRNSRLTEGQKNEAPLIYRALIESKRMFNDYTLEEIRNNVATIFDESENLKLEYFEIADIETLKTMVAKEESVKYRAFIGVYADKIRLIDNIALN